MPDGLKETGSPSAQDKKSLLLAHTFIESLDDEDVDRLAQHARLMTYGAGETIFRKGDPGLSMMVVIKGCVRISTITSEAKEIVLNLIQAGEVVGEIALLDGKERSADATAIQFTEALVLERRDFLPVLERNPRAAIRMLEVLCDRLRRTSEQVEDLIMTNAVRFARVLVRLAEQFGHEVDVGMQIDLRLSQSELGKITGTTRETLNRQLAEWREQDIIALESGKIVIRNMRALKRIGDGER
ncbi:MAG: cyclic nucleotide-binding domain-containing protein [Alphaproteobacteria bacterium]|nr:cyclic nucleotide-binding domain-containing protein [Alphaproteobacteria bacterium]